MTTARTATAATQRPGERPVRRGLVLGAGGVLGAAWTIGALSALLDAGQDAAGAEVVVGTSAGSVLTAMLASGVTVPQMVANQQGIVVEGSPQLDYDHDTDSGGALPPLPRLRLGSAGLLRTTVLHPRSLPPAVAIASLLPEGRGTLAPLGRMIDAVKPATWPVGPPVPWVVAMDYDTGKRTVFGRAGSPTADLRDAVLASCSIPGWYAPVRIDGRRYVDGGTCSPTSLDLLAPLGLDEVVVLAPMAATSYDAPHTVAGRVERRLRRGVSRRLEREAVKVRAAGTKVVVLAPGTRDLEVMGANLMDPRRREATFRTAQRTTAAALRAALAPAGLAAAG